MPNRAPPIPEPLLGLLNDAATNLLATDPDSRAQLAGLAGKVACLEISAPSIAVYALCTPNGIAFAQSATAAPDVTLRGSLAAVANLAGGGRSGAGLSIHGDAEFAQSLQKILARLDLDWEELLAQRIGDTAARKAANLAREIRNWGEQSAGLTRENIADYLREERQLLAHPAAVARFEADLQTTRADVDRLAQRVQRILQNLT